MRNPKLAHLTVAIDGPAGAGKSSVAKALADRLGLERLDTGAMYRAVAWMALHVGVEPTDTEKVAKLVEGIQIEVGSRVTVDTLDATEGIRTAKVDAAVSAVAANSVVRRCLVSRQRQWVADHGGGVVEGRDIGTVVLPEADAKIYLTASLAARAARRARERVNPTDLQTMEEQMSARDRHDSERRDSPLVSVEDVAGDALVVDSTGRSIDQVVEEVLAWL